MKTHEIQLPTPLAIQPEEREMLTPRDKRTVSQWAEAERVLSKKTTYYSGRWTHELLPWAVPIMDALSDLTTREVWERACAQSGKTEIGLNFMGQTITDDPMPFMQVMPTKEDIRARFRTRIRPMIAETPSLLKQLPGGNINKLNIGQETEFLRMFLYLGWMTVAMAMADKAIGRIQADEIAKSQKVVGDEADPVNLLRERMTTYSAVSKFYAPSTPVLVGDRHDREFDETTQEECWIQCPFCKQRHIPSWQYVDLDKDSARGLLSPKDYLSGQCARYICPKCEKRWTEQDRWEAVTNYKWAQRDCIVETDGKIKGRIFSNPKRGFTVPSFLVYPGFVTMSKLAAQWASAQTAKKAGDIGPLQDFINSRLAQPWEEREKETDATRLAAHISSYQPASIPKGVQLLTAGIDIQIDHVWVLVIGWGWLSEIWTIDEERLETGDTKDLANFQIVRDWLSQRWPMAEDPQLSLTLSKIAIDCAYRPEQAKDFCRMCTNLPIIPVRGSPRVTSRVSSRFKEPDDVMIRYDLNTNAIKDTLWQIMFEATEPGPGYVHLHSQTTKEVLEHLTSEHQVTERKGSRKGQRVWKPKKESDANHIWDCLVYAWFAGQISGATMLRDPEKKIKQPKRKIGRMDRFDR